MRHAVALALPAAHILAGMRAHVFKGALDVLHLA
jgi:hypothetical protein